jgi:hypothetical protein
MGGRVTGKDPVESQLAAVGEIAFQFHKIKAVVFDGPRARVSASAVRADLETWRLLRRSEVVVKGTGQRAQPLPLK